MRKKVILVLAAALIVTVGLHHMFITERLVGVESELSDIPKPNQEEPDSAEFEAEEEPDPEFADEGEPDTAEFETEEESGITESVEEEEPGIENDITKDITESVAGEEALIDGTKADMGTTGEETEIESEADDERGEIAGKAFPENAEEPAAGKAVTGFFALSSHEAVVYNHLELKEALSNNNGITTVYFGDNIATQAGIRINPQKTNVVIDGFNPLDSGQTEPYTLTEYSSVSFYDTIYIDAVGTKSLLIRDLTIKGRNFYGPFSILDAVALAGVSVTYERVDYDGPQMGYHRSGTIRFKDCTARIHGGNGGSPNQEFSEVKHVVFEGVNAIHTETSAYSIFWTPLGGSFKIADDASLVLDSPNTSTVFGIFYADGAIYKIDVSIGNRAVFNATISGVVAPDPNVTLSSFMVKEGGAFHLSITESVTGPALTMGGAITVEKDAEFIISGHGGASYALLRQESGDITVGKDAVFQLIADSPYTELLNLVGRALICNDPASVLLYNANRDIRASTSVGRIYINAQQLNYWNRLSSGGLDDIPLYRWDKPDKTNFWLDGTLATGSSGNFTSISSNYDSGAPPGVPPNATTFSMPGARVIAAGRLELIVADPTIESTSIGGVTSPGATVRVSFTQQGTDYTFPDVQADSDGVFHVPVDVTLNASTVIKVSSNWQYLTTSEEKVVSGEGALELFVPKVLEFFDTELSATTKTIRRLNPDWKIVVSGSGGAGIGWSIYARLNSEMTPAAANRPILNGALVFADDFGDTTVMSTDADTLIRKHISTETQEIVPVSWDKNKGVLLVVKPGTAFTDTTYTASISWTLVNGV